jgi:hypothetical protein
MKQSMKMTLPRDSGAICITIVDIYLTRTKVTLYKIFNCHIRHSPNLAVTIHTSNEVHYVIVTSDGAC